MTRLSAVAMIVIIFSLSTAVMAEVTAAGSGDSGTAALGNQAPPPREGWKAGAVIGSNATYNNFDNWSAGGVNSTSFGIMSGFTAKYLKERNQFNAVLKLDYGVARVEMQDYKKSIDSVSLDLIYTYAMTTRLKPYANLLAKSQMAKSYEYFETRTDVRAGGDYYAGLDKFAISRGFDPFNLEQGVGLQLIVLDSETANLNFNVGIGGRELISSDYFVRTDIATTMEIEYDRIEESSDLGVEAGYTLKWKFYENMELGSKLKAFYAANKGESDKNNTVTSWENTLSMKVNKFVSVNASADMIYDTNVIERAQWRQVILVSLSYQLF